MLAQRSVSLTVLLVVLQEIESWLVAYETTTRTIGSTMCGWLIPARQGDLTRLATLVPNLAPTPGFEPGTHGLTVRRPYP